jgi:hypothetical protein
MRFLRPMESLTRRAKAHCQKRQDGCVAKNMLGHKNTERHFSSGGNLEEALHESHLSANVAFPDSFNLALPDHVRDFITADGPSRRIEAKEAESGIDSAFG